MKRYVSFFLLLLSFSGFAQNSINNYKYVVVPERFSFLKEANQYRLNTLTKGFLEEQGFTAYFDNAEMPNDVSSDRCSALNAEVIEKKSMFVTKLTLLLKDCKGNIVFKSKEGSSREKEYTASYRLALQDAFTSLAEAKYVYTAPAQVTVTVMPPAPPRVVTTATPQVVPSQAEGTLYAQPTATGYQLIDTSPKKILTLFKTSSPDYFIANNDSSNGVVFKKGDNWVFEYYKNGSLMSETLLIKF